MNTRPLFVLLVAAIIVTACTPAITDGSAPVAAAPAADSQASGIIPVSGAVEVTTVRSGHQAPRLWSGEIFLSDTNAPDTIAAPHAKPNNNVQEACTSADALPRRYGGCVE